MDEFIIKTPGEELYGAVIDLILQDFRMRERMNVCSGATSFKQPENNSELEFEVYRGWLKQGVSLVMLDPRNGLIIGVALNNIVSKSGNSFEITPSMPLRQRFFYTVVNDLESGVDIFEELQTDQGMDLTLLSVREEYSGRGFGRKLAEETIMLAKKLEFKFVQSIPTAPQTIHLFEALGFETRKERKLEEMSFEGSPAFPLATAIDRARYAIKKL